MKSMDLLTWDEMGHARAQLSGRHDVQPFIGPFTELAAILDANVHDKRRREIIEKISSFVPLLTSECLEEIEAVISKHTGAQE